MITKKRYTFKCGRWLDKKEDDGSEIREMPAEGDNINKVQPRTFLFVLLFNVAVLRIRCPGHLSRCNVVLVQWCNIRCWCTRETRWGLVRMPMFSSTSLASKVTPATGRWISPRITKISLRRARSVGKNSDNNRLSI